VVVAHSQGTILASEIMTELREHAPSLARRIEVCNFAFCADEFPDDCCAHLEHFANENDFVAALSPAPGNPYDLPGQCMCGRAAWGHFPGAHYLEPFRAGEFKDGKGGGGSQLLSYLDGR
jgi:hypothetical protein